MLLMDGVMRAMYRDGGPEPRASRARRGRRVTIDLADIHHTIAAGNRIEVDVTSSNFPRRARNTNSGNPMLADDGPEAVRVATNAVHHDAARPSSLMLTVLPRDGQAFG